MAKVKTPPPILPKKLTATNKAASATLYSADTASQIRDQGTDTFINQSINDLRQTDPIRVIRTLSKTNGSFSKNVWSYVQIAMSGYRVTCRDSQTHTFNAEATAVAQSILSSLNTLYDYTQGYGDKQSVNGLLETLLKETVLAGGCSIELVLNKYYLPENLIALPVTDLKWFPKSSGTGKYPKQQNRSGKGEAYIPLDIPTFFYAETHRDSTANTNNSPLEPALQMLFLFYEFLEDIAKTVRSSGHSRMVIQLIQDKIMPNIPQEIRDDPDKLRSELEHIRSSVERIVSDLAPEDALVTFDTVTIDTLKKSGEKADYTALMETFGSLLASSLKSMPSVLGLAGAGGSQNLATTEAMVFLKLCRAMQVPVETVMSRLMTLAVRLVAELNVYCLFEFNPIELRSVTELAAHRTTLMNDDKWLLSAGFLTDAEFAHRWGIALSPDHVPLSGTGFMNNSSAAVHPADVQQNIQGGVRALNEGTVQGTPASRPAGGNNQ